MMMLSCSVALKMLYACTVLGLGWGFQPGLRRTCMSHLDGCVTAAATANRTPEDTEAFSDDDPLIVKSFLPQDNPVDILSNRKQQLWIDLRDTSLFPHEANTFLMDQLFHDVSIIDEDLKFPFSSSPALFDAALVSETMLETIILRRTTGTSHYNTPYCLLCTPAEGNQLVIDESVSQKSYVIGRTIMCDSSRKLDPLEALKTVIDEQNWLLIDYKDRAAARASVSQVTDVLQLLASPSASVTLEQYGTKTELSSEFALQGGIAVVCTDVNSFIQLDAKLAEIQSAASLGETMTTQSGLIVPTVHDQQSSSTLRSSVRSVALVLPFDLDLWKAADDIRDLRNPRNSQLLP
jgi:hypothetical protein